MFCPLRHFQFIRLSVEELGENTHLVIFVPGGSRKVSVCVCVCVWSAYECVCITLGGLNFCLSLSMIVSLVCLSAVRQLRLYKHAYVPVCVPVSYIECFFETLFVLLILSIGALGEMSKSLFRSCLIHLWKLRGHRQGRAHPTHLFLLPNPSLALPPPPHTHTQRPTCQYYLIKNRNLLLRWRWLWINTPWTHGIWSMSCPVSMTPSSPSPSALWMEQPCCRFATTLSSTVYIWLACTVPSLPILLLSLHWDAATKSSQVNVSLLLPAMLLSTC